MQFIFCAITLVAIVLDFLQAAMEQELFKDLRSIDCYYKSLPCQKKMVTKVTPEEITGLCNAKPLDTISSKCLIDCQMRQYKWIDGNGFQKKKYLAYMKNTNLGVNDREYQRAAKNAADLCEDKKAPHEDSCETAYLIMQCLQDEGNKQQHTNLGYDIFYVRPSLFP